MWGRLLGGVVSDCRAQSSVCKMERFAKAIYSEPFWHRWKQFGIKVFEACCSLTQIGATSHTTNQLAPQAQLQPRAFEKCTALRHLNLELAEYDPTNPRRCLPECCFLEAGIVSLSLPPDFNWVGPAACERCQQLQIVDLSRTEVIEILGSTFPHCSICNRLASLATCEG